MKRIWCVRPLFFILFLVPLACLPDSQGRSEFTNGLLDGGRIVKITKDTVFLEDGEKVYLPGITSGNGTYNIIIRHAETDTIGMDPGLSRRGETRSTQLASILQNVPIKQVHITHYRRMYLTVRPLVELKSVGIRRYEPGDQMAFIEQLDQLEGSQLICGHSNTIPELLSLISDVKLTKDLKHYSNIWFVSRDGKGTVQHFTF